MRMQKPPSDNHYYGLRIHPVRQADWEIDLQLGGY